MEKPISASGQADGEIRNTKQVPRIEQIQAELANLIIRIQRLPERDLDEINNALDKINSQLHDLVDTETSLAASQAQTENKLPSTAHSAEPLASLGARFTMVTYAWDLRTDRLHFSPGLEKITGFSPEPDAKHHWWLKKLFLEDREKIEPILARIRLEQKKGQPDLNQQDAYEFEYRVRHADGSWVGIWDRGRIERDKQGRPLRVVGIIEDITALKNMQKTMLLSYKALTQSNIALRKQEEQMRSALANVPVVFFQTDKNLCCTWIYSPTLDDWSVEFMGKRVDEVMDAESAAALMAVKQTALDTWTRQIQEVTINWKGKPRQVFVAAQPVFDDDKNPSGVVGTLVDITEQRSLENLASEKAFKLELNRRLREQAEKEQQQIGRFIQDGPIQDLSGIGFALQLVRQLFPNPEALGVLEQLKEEVRNLVIELRQISNTLRPPGLTRFGLSHAVQSYTEEFQLRNPNMKINLVLSDSGAGLSDGTIQALFRIIEESFLNILHHADASEVTINLSILPGNIHMEIKDNGCGFEGQPDWMRLTSQGHYGMLRMKESAEGLGGTLRIQSEPRQGTVVVAEVPLVE